MSEQKILDLPNYKTSPQYSEAERTALEWADAMTLSHLDTTDELFERLRQFYSDDQIVELSAVVAFENFRSKFNHAMRVPSIHHWRGQP